LSFAGRVKETSHKGGLIASFEGRPPRLGTSIRITGGRILGKVETVLGPVDRPLIHILPVFDGVDTRAAIGSPIEIAPRVRGGSRKRNDGRNTPIRGREKQHRGRRPGGAKSSKDRGRSRSHHNRKPAGRGFNPRKGAKGKRGQTKGRGGTRGRRR